MQCVAGGKLEPSPEAGWRITPLSREDTERVVLRARSPAHAEVEDGEALVRGMLDAVADALPRSAPSGVRRSAAAPLRRDGRSERLASRPFSASLQSRLAKHLEPDDRPHLVTLSLRIGRAHV